MGGSRKSPRLTAILPLKVLVGTESEVLYAYTIDISASGVRIILPLALEEGCEVALEYKKNRARAVVAWSRQRSRTSNDFETGLRLLDDGQRFWLVEFAPKAEIVASTGLSDTSGMARKSRSAG